jgi:transcriptional regulator with XRE-family HTH domain
MRLRKALAANLKRIRLAAKLSQEELAHRADMDRTYVSSLERGNYAATVDMLERIADALGVEPVELLRPEDAATERNLTP